MKKNCLFIALSLISMAVLLGVENTSYANVPDRYVPRYEQDVQVASCSARTAGDFYVGMTIQEFDNSIDKKLLAEGWKKTFPPNASFGRSYEKVMDNEIMEKISFMVLQDTISSYMIFFYTKSKATADEIYMKAYKNLSEDIGDPEYIAVDGDNSYWSIDDGRISIQLISMETSSQSSSYPYCVKIFRNLRGD